VRGIDASVARDLAAAGPTSFFVYRWPVSLEVCTGSDGHCLFQRNPPLTLAEAEAIAHLPEIRGVAAHRGWSAAFTYENRSLSEAAIDCYTASWTDVDAGDIYPGRSFTSREAASGARVTIINQQMAARLFGPSDPTGKLVGVNGIPFRVIGIYHSGRGVLGAQGGASGGDGPQAIIPLKTAHHDLGISLQWLDFTVTPRNGKAQREAMDAVSAVLRGMRGLTPGTDNGFTIVPAQTLREAYDSFLGVVGALMIAFTAVGLLIGGVGVVAIMMISVTERTREIGVRKALGATRGTILWQFLVEAATLTSMGAMAGLIVGGVLAGLIKTETPIPASISPSAIVLALATAALTGLVFGTFPALRAARLDPAQALRYE
jgi:putative ABC transport system permease protein